MTTATKTDPLAERHRWLSEIKGLRVRQGEARSKQIQAAQRSPQASECLHAAELDMARGVKGAEERVRKAAAEVAAAKEDEARHARMVDLTQEAINLAEQQIRLLYENHLEAFAEEAMAKDAVALKKGAAAARAISEYRQAWHEAGALWQRLHAALVGKVEDLDREEGRSRDHSTVVRECQAPPFPVQATDSLLARPPRPAAVNRLALSDR